ncbi:MAG: hypothetical protein O8C62_07380 [Candidatus Methanoperedens sp.]|nr:hypothetical protein [Candidatus Methanoperedens sp.]
MVLNISKGFTCIKGSIFTICEQIYSFFRSPVLDSGGAGHEHGGGLGIAKRWGGWG